MSLFLALVILICSSPELRSQYLSRDPWEKLEGRGGWIHLGFVTDLDKKSWVSKPGFGSGSEDEALPKQGDSIVLKTAHRLHIVEYLISGEKKIEVSPTDRPISPWDDTEIVLPAGSKLFVERLEISSNIKNKRSVWVFVSPINF